MLTSIKLLENQIYLIIGEPKIPKYREDDIKDMGLILTARVGGALVLNGAGVSEELSVG